MNKEAAGREAGCFFWEERRGAHIAKPLENRDPDFQGGQAPPANFSTSAKYFWNLQPVRVIIIQYETFSTFIKGV